MSNPEIRVSGSFESGLIIIADPPLNLAGNGPKGINLTPYQAKKLLNLLQAKMEEESKDSYNDTSND